MIHLRPTTRYALLRCFGQFIFVGMIIMASFYFALSLMLSILVIPCSIILFRVIYWRTVQYEISMEQIKFTRGIFQRKVDFLEMYRIKDFHQQQSLLMRMLGLMHIRLMTSDISHPMLELKGIPNSNIADVLRQLVERSRKENRVYAID